MLKWLYFSHIWGASGFFVTFFQLFLFSSSQVVATDADSREFGELLYSLSDGFDKQDQHPLFEIHPHTGELCVSQDIDRDSGQTVHDILIKAEDPVSDAVSETIGL